MDTLITNRERVVVKQVKEWGEIILSFETRNRFQLCDEDGTPIGYAAEEGGGLGAMLLRNMLGHCRACKVHLYDNDGQELGTGVKPFRFYFHRMELFEGGKKLGAIQRRFSFIHRLFTLEDDQGNEILRIKSPFFRIWTFKLLLDDIEVGLISKKFGGALKELFTDADTFVVEFGHPKLPVEVKKLLLVAVFLIDFVCFETNQ